MLACVIPRGAAYRAGGALADLQARGDLRRQAQRRRAERVHRQVPESGPSKLHSKLAELTVS